MKYLYYKAAKKVGEGLLDRRSCLMILLAEAKLSNRIAVVPKFRLGSKHNNGQGFESYMIDTYFSLENIDVEYILEEHFIEIKENIQPTDILRTKNKKFNYNTSHTLVIRELKHDNIWRLKHIYDAYNLAKLYHGFGVKYVIPQVAATKTIKEIGDRIINSLEGPIVGLHLRRGDRLNTQLNKSMHPDVIVDKLNDFNFNSAFYCSNDPNYKIENTIFFSSYNFQHILGDIEDNYMLFSIEMYVVDNCDISVRTFSDSSPVFHTTNTKEKNYSICNYSMHGSENSYKKIPNRLTKCDYESIPHKRKTFAKSKPIIPRLIAAVERRIKRRLS